MTTHLDDEQLAEWALSGQQPDAAASGHLRQCDRCRASLAELRELAGLTAELPRLEHPPTSVWQRLHNDLDLQLPTVESNVGVVDALDNRAVHDGGIRPTMSGDDSAHPTDVAARNDRGTSRFGRRSLVLAASVAAVLGLGAGIGGTLVLTDRGNQTSVEAVVKLEPLDGKTGDGSADLIRSTAGNKLKVAATGLDATSGFYEVWLINTDGRRMVSLGVLDPRAGGTFQIPAELTTQGYRIVDISLEPDDGNPEHSHDSVIRGTLPA